MSSHLAETKHHEAFQTTYLSDKSIRSFEPPKTALKCSKFQQHGQLDNVKQTTAQAAAVAQAARKSVLSNFIPAVNLLYDQRLTPYTTVLI